MTNIIELAKEAGFEWNEVGKRLEAFAALVRAETLEQAAKVCDEISVDIPYNCAAAIRGLK